MRADLSFARQQRASQIAFFQRSLPPEAVRASDPVQLGAEAADAALNLAPAVRHIAARYFRRHNVSWHRFAHHGCSSQICCLNFLMPLATRPDLAAPIIARALGVPSVELLQVETGPDDQPWYIGFEWIGKDNYLGEWGKSRKPARGANVTSADAIVQARVHGRIETILIEWKYTERYSSQIKSGSMATRHGRYDTRIFSPTGPLKPNDALGLADFMWEPFYQLLRQQMLAWHMEKSGESGAERVTVLHLSPAGNGRLHDVTAPKLKALGNDAFDVFQSLLEQSNRFQARSIEAVFGPSVMAASQGDAVGRAWADYLIERYDFLSRPSSAA